MRIVVDTSVVIAALRSRQGASASLLIEIAKGTVANVLSYPLALEYEEKLTEHAAALGLTQSDIDVLMDNLAGTAVVAEVFFRWRPFLADADDDLVMEAALAGQAQYIVTHNVRNFRRAEGMDIRVVTPGQVLAILG